jgi:predicted transcriptional regulator
MKADQRIGGKKLFKGGLGFGGPCFPRDTICFGVTCKKHSVPAYMSQAVNNINIRQIERSVELVESFGKKRIAFLGLTYKENTTLVDESQSLRIARELARKGYEIWAYDPKGERRAMQTLSQEKVNFCSSINQCVSKGEVVFIGVPWADFYQLETKDFLPEQIVVDPWRIMKNKKLNLKYVPYGLARTHIDTDEDTPQNAIQEIGIMKKYVTILEDVFQIGPQNLAQISRRTNINLHELEKHMDFLIRQKLINEHVDNRDVTFAISQLGITMMKKFHEMKTTPSTIEETKKMIALTK